jgi:hypothetical protein
MSDGDTITAALFNNEFNQLLSAFSYASSGTTGHQHDGGAGEGGNIEIIGDQDFLNKIVVDSTNNRWGFFVQVSSSAVEQIRIQDGAIVPVTDNDIDLGTSSLEFKDGYFDGTVYADAINFNGTAISATAAELNIMDGVTATASELNILDGVTSTATELNIVDGNTSATSTTLADADRVVVNDNGTMVQVALTDFETYFESALDTLSNVTTVGTLGSGAISSGFGNIDIGSSNLTATGTISLGATSFNDQNITNVGSIQLDSIAGDGDTNTSLTFSGSDVITIATGGTTALTIDASQNVTVAGDLTVTGDDITMGTNTAGNLLVADGTNFNSIAVGSLSEISTVANDDVFIAVDTSGGGLKKIARSAIVAGLATSGAISNVADDSTPQLGGDLDMNGQDIVTTSNADIELAPNGTGHVTVKGNTNSGAIQFNCESNSHGQIVQAQPHSAGVTNTMLLPAGSNSTLVSLVSTDTLTNKTLTSPKINEDVVVTSTATELNILDGVTATTAELNTLDGITAVVGELNALDLGSTAVGTAIASKAVILDSNKDYTGLRNLTITGELDAATLDISGDVDIDGTLEADAITIDGATLAETISDTVGAMVSSNTETGITVTYQDADNTLDFALGAAQTTITSLLATDIKIGEDDQTKIDFEDADTINFYAGNEKQLILTDGALTPGSNAIVDLGTDALEFKDAYFDGTVEADAISIGGTAVTSTAAELNILDGVTATATELNYLDISTLGTTEASKAVTADANGVVKFDNGIQEESTAVSSSSNAATINLRDGTVFTHTLSENVTYTFSNPAASGYASTFTLKVTQDSSARTITWPGSVDWAGGTAPTISTGNGEVDVFVFHTVDGGTTYYGFTAGQDLS